MRLYRTVVSFILPLAFLVSSGVRAQHASLAVSPDQAVLRFSLSQPLRSAPPEDAFPSALPGDTAAYPPPFDGYHPDSTSVRWDHALIVGGALTGTVAAIHIYQQNAWWKDRRTSFHFVDDQDYALNVDKAGHFLGGAFGAFLGEKSLEWSGVSRDGSAIWGSVLGALFELYVEVEDGYALDWGFSKGDAIGDVAGAAWTLGQHFVPILENFQPKFTYYPSKKFRDGLHHGNAIDDYEGQTYWMAVHVHGLLPKSWKPYWPEWLAIAVGASVRNMADFDGATGADKERNIIISLDYDMTKILPTDTWWMRTLAEFLNFIHFPAPAIRISPNYIAYGLYF
ncbi:MAG: hypothetical protein IPP94_10310 [Ignavibacteria bacterium]|nr:hypothetical protein [Ignavibacteria bacterium]